MARRGEQAPLWGAGVHARGDSRRSRPGIGGANRGLAGRAGRESQVFFRHVASAKRNRPCGAGKSFERLETLMICPNCKSKMRVSHPKTDHTGTYRTRRCKCGYRMETLEASVEAYDRQALQRYEDRTRKVLAE